MFCNNRTSVIVIRNRAGGGVFNGSCYSSSDVAMGKVIDVIDFAGKPSITSKRWICLENVAL